MLYPEKILFSHLVGERGAGYFREFLRRKKWNMEKMEKGC